MSAGTDVFIHALGVLTRTMQSALTTSPPKVNHVWSCESNSSAQAFLQEVSRGLRR